LRNEACMRNGRRTIEITGVNRTIIRVEGRSFDATIESTLGDGVAVLVSAARCKRSATSAGQRLGALIETLDAACEIGPFGNAQRFAEIQIGPRSRTGCGRVEVQPLGDHQAHCQRRRQLRGGRP
jgi:hypothetical protein